VDLDTGNTDALFRSLMAAERPLAYLVSNDDLDDFRQLGSFVVDRGKKDGRKGLWAIVNGYDAIPLIATGYEEAGRVHDGVRKLLAQAAKHNEKNAYVVGVEPDLFEELWKGRPEASRTVKPALQRGGWTSELLPTRCLLRALPHQKVPEELRSERYIGESPHVELVRRLVMAAADKDCSVLIVGPTGSGKENVARAIHDFGSRRGLPFVSVNTAAITPSIFESELFGSVRGSFTDAKVDRPGLWVASGAGTLLLDEIGDLSVDLQVKILRALENNEVRPVGGSATVRVQARVIAATNRDLFAMVRAGQFRDDLYYRLRSFRIETPPLRDHVEDIPAIARALWRKQVTRREDAGLSDDIVAALQGFRWPGNVRELRSVLIQLYALFGNPNPTLEELRLVLTLQGQESPSVLGPPDERELVLHRVECLRHLRHVDEALQACHATLRPIVEEKRTDRATVKAVHEALHYRLLELERLCQTPLLFREKLTFEIAERLTHELADFHRKIEDSPAEAMQYWEAVVSRDLKVALSAIFQEVDRLICAR
jgi:DNA-binding NtrC family response regulator